MICPLEFRYGREEIKKIFSEESKLSYLLKVEASLAKAHAILGNIPEEAGKEIAVKANLKYVKLERVKEIEREIRHDVMAVVKALAEQCKYGKYVHLGATSYDIVDTANALQIIDALSIIEKEMVKLVKTLANLALKHKSTIMIGRTHGQHALPITFGLKMAVYATEVGRHIQRLRRVKEEISFGKMAGAVGTGASFGDKFFEIQKIVMEELGLNAELPATQIVGRDRYIELLSFLANVAVSMEKFATEIRNLQRTEIAEVEEFFEEKQVGSSTMPHKRNPVICEQICGLARIIRSNVVPAWENAIQWHERDLCNSSAERFILPHSLILTDWIVYKMNEVFSKLIINAEKMRENIEISKGLIFTEAIMMKLVERGMSRQEAHEIMRKYAMEAREKGLHLKEVLKENKMISEIFDSIANYTGNAEKIVDIAIQNLREKFPEIGL
ncbi:adenylosuccinate lyase [Thermoplasmatales archaeon ex4484_30]|nr:MAG: adenylosuccinate lyase [Thermoplasmata archaeon]OYT60860.1 MAG: adenylosuccinate lyase [Thermoplasmatales archaeon ex4484_30]